MRGRIPAPSQLRDTGPWSSPAGARPSAVVIRRHRLTIAASITLRVLLAAFLTAILTVSAASRQEVAVLLAAAAASITLSWTRWRANVCLLAGSTLEIRRGLHFRSRRLIPLVAVQDVTVEQSPAGWLMRYGTVEVRLRAGPPLRLDWIPNPEGFRGRLLRAGLDQLSLWRR